LFNQLNAEDALGRPTNTDERRAQIVTGLRKAMARSGYDGASIADIARAARVPPGIVHYHFKDKREILLALLASLVDEHQAGLDAALARAKGDPRRELDLFLDAHLATGKNGDPEALICWVAICAEALREPAVRAAYSAAATGIHRRLASIIRHGVAAKQFRCRAPEAAVAAIAATVQGYLVLAATARELIPRGTAAAAAKAMAKGLLGSER
jgi:TetR/AcrR family transcriptional repressor of bet genes